MCRTFQLAETYIMDTKIYKKDKNKQKQKKRTCLHVTAFTLMLFVDIIFSSICSFFSRMEKYCSCRSSSSFISQTERKETSTSCVENVTISNNQKDITTLRRSPQNAVAHTHSTPSELCSAYFITLDKTLLFFELAFRTCWTRGSSRSSPPSRRGFFWIGSSSRSLFTAIHQEKLI